MKYKFNDFNKCFKDTKNKQAKKLSEWIVSSIMKLPSEDLKQFYLLIENELKKRGDF